MPSWSVAHGDCTKLLPLWAADGFCVDAVVTDPPYFLESIAKRFKDVIESTKGVTADRLRNRADGMARLAGGFMGQKWDTDVAHRPEVWKAVYDVMKPGAYLLAFSSSRTFDLCGSAIRQAGFVIHPFFAWCFGQGFPKAHKVEDEAWKGWYYGTQSLKPAIEPILFAQKPMSEKTGTANVLRFGTGAVNIDICRVPTSNADKNGYSNRPSRWPANLIHDGSAEVVSCFPNTPGQLARAKFDGSPQGNKIYGALSHNTRNPEPRNDTGSAARFFNACPFTEYEKRLLYYPKANKTDRAGSSHPTVKPISLMRHLCRLVCPPGGLVLDPFAGSGTTLEAAYLEGFNSVGIEQETQYVADIHNRMSKHRKDVA